MELRSLVYRRLAATGTAPSRVELAEGVGDDAVARSVLRELHDRHVLVLDDADEVLMALPFATRPSEHRVVANSGSWWAKLCVGFARGDRSARR